MYLTTGGEGRRGDLQAVKRRTESLLLRQALAIQTQGVLRETESLCKK